METDNITTSSAQTKAVAKKVVAEQRRIVKRFIGVAVVVAFTCGLWVFGNTFPPQVEPPPALGNIVEEGLSLEGFSLDELSFEGFSLDELSLDWGDKADDEPVDEQVATPKDTDISETTTEVTTDIDESDFFAPNILIADNEPIMLSDDTDTADTPDTTTTATVDKSPEAEATPKPTEEPIAKPVPQPTPSPEIKPVDDEVATEPAAKPEAQPSTKSEAKPAPEPVAKIAAKPEAKPAPTPAAKPKPAAKPAPKPAAKPEAKPVAKPANQTKTGKQQTWPIVQGETTPTTYQVASFRHKKNAERYLQQLRALNLTADIVTVNIITVNINKQNSYYRVMLSNVDKNNLAQIKQQVAAITDGGGTTKPAAKPAAKPAPKPAPKPAAKPAAPQKSFAIQVGAFRKTARIKEITQKLEAAGYTVKVQPTTRNGVQIQRVRVVGISSKAMAETVRRQLIALGYVHATIINLR